MVQSLLVGFILAVIYSYTLHKGTFGPASLTPNFRFAGVLRIVAIGLVFVVLAEFTTLNIAQVLIAFITVISLYLFKQAGGAILAGLKTGGAPSQRRS